MLKSFGIFLCALFLYTSLSAQEGRFWDKLLDGDIQCRLCPRECVLSDGRKGRCRVRKNIKGRLVSLVYARPCSLNVDPIEKKPLFHFLPGTTTLSLATAGCNLRCVFCQNWSISQAEPEDVETIRLFPEKIPVLAAERGTPSVSYTYSEPTSFYEYMYDSALLARQHKVRNVWITCGYMNPKPLEELCGVIDAANVDLKGFSDNVYRRIAAARLAPVLETIKTLKSRGVWLEVGYLVIPGLNDGEKELNALTDWMAKELGPDVPLHFLRFFPRHKLVNTPPTPIETLERAYAIAKRSGLNYVYLGNVPGHKAENTYCPKCGKTLIKRKGYFVEEMTIKNGRCPSCGKKIAGVWG